MYSPLWKITHQSPSVLCTPPFGKSSIKSRWFCVLPPLKNHTFWWALISGGDLCRSVVPFFGVVDLLRRRTLFTSPGQLFSASNLFMVNVKFRAWKTFPSNFLGIHSNLRNFTPTYNNRTYSRCPILCFFSEFFVVHNWECFLRIAWKIRRKKSKLRFE